ncbi:hypothetical protein B484DRAFT_435359, partial [Ochromonadaceae sp. CCMP2298]
NTANKGNTVNTEYASAGGGFVNIVANRSLTLNGTITSCGSAALPGEAGSGAGGGAGGTVFVAVRKFKGSGSILATGGAGADAVYPGGGGSGGDVTVFNHVGNYMSYTWMGVLSVDGGAQGATEYLESNGSHNGYNVCSKCTNKPTHATYSLDTGGVTSDCPYICDSGYSTKYCYTPFQNFVFNTLGLVGATLSAMFIFGIILLPLLYIRYRKEYGWMESMKHDEGMGMSVGGIGGMGLLGENFNSETDSRGFQGPGLERAGASASAKRRLSAGGFASFSPPHASPGRVGSIGLTHLLTLIDLGLVLGLGLGLGRRVETREHRKRVRLQSRLVDADLVKHACRITLLGSNHPHQARGGPWRLPLSRPPCLRPTLRREQWRALAEAVNMSVAWNPWGMEMCAFYAVALVLPPLAAILMKQFRQRRVDLLLRLVSAYDHACFRCPMQRKARNSIRIGISPDATLVYLDVLFDEEHFRPRTRPLCPVGQVRLPASFKLAGLGTYCTPYYVDTNDLLLQAVPQTDIPSSFINDAWIAFIVELNAVLRTLQSDAYYFGIRRLVRFLEDPNTTLLLGGLKVQFCTMPNTETFHASEHVWMQGGVRGGTGVGAGVGVGQGMGAGTGTKGHPVPLPQPDALTPAKSSTSQPTTPAPASAPVPLIPKRGFSSWERWIRGGGEQGQGQAQGGGEQGQGDKTHTPHTPRTPHSAQSATTPDSGYFQSQNPLQSSSTVPMPVPGVDIGGMGAGMAAGMGVRVGSYTDTGVHKTFDRLSQLTMDRDKDRESALSTTSALDAPFRHSQTYPYPDPDARLSVASAATDTATENNKSFSYYCCSCLKCLSWPLRLLSTALCAIAYFPRLLRALLQKTLLLCGCGNPTIDPRDTVGYSLDFMQTCDAIREGRLSLGLVVTHEK